MVSSRVAVRAMIFVGVEGQFWVDRGRRHTVGRLQVCPTPGTTRQKRVDALNPSELPIRTCQCGPVSPKWLPSRVYAHCMRRGRLSPISRCPLAISPQKQSAEEKTSDMICELYGHESFLTANAPPLPLPSGHIVDTVFPSRRVRGAAAAAQQSTEDAYLPTKHGIAYDKSLDSHAKRKVSCSGKRCVYTYSGKSGYCSTLSE